MILIPALVFVGCSGNRDRGYATGSPTPNGEEAHGVRCSTAGELGPPSYLVRDIGKADIPALNGRQKRIAQSFLKKHSPKTLRFAFVSREFIVYDAVNGPCSMAVPYAVVNGDCSEMYAPIDRPFHTVGGGQCYNTANPITTTKP